MIRLRGCNMLSTNRKCLELKSKAGPNICHGNSSDSVTMLLLCKRGRRVKDVIPYKNTTLTLAGYFQNNEAAGSTSRSIRGWGLYLTPKASTKEEFFHGITVKPILNFDFMSHRIATWAHFEIYLQDFVNDFEIYQGLKLKIKWNFLILSFSS